MAADPAVETVKLPNGDLYVGSIADGKPHGQGSRVCVLLRCFALPLCSAAYGAGRGAQPPQVHPPARRRVLRGSAARGWPAPGRR